MEFSPLLFIFIIWLCIGLPLSKLNQAAKKKTGSQKLSSGRPAAPAEARKETPKPSAAPAEPLTRDTRLIPTVTVTANDDSIYAGSMNAVTGEGHDPCHEEDLAGLNTAEAISVQPIADEHSLPFGWTGNDIVRGIVVSEILNRRNTRRAS